MRMAFFAILLALAGCGVMQPHIDVPPEIADTGPLAGGLSAEITRAKGLQQRYLDAVADQTLVTNGLAMTAIPISAAALAVGIVNPGAGMTRSFLVGSGVGVATGLGVGSFLVDRRRDLIYYNGARQIYCLRLAITPLSIERSEFELIRRDVEALRTALGEAAAGGVDPRLIDLGTQLFATGRTLVREIALSGPTFASELDKINIAVNAQIASEDRSLTDVATAIGAIQKGAAGLAPAPELRTQGGRIVSLGGDAALRRAIGLVAAWLAAYQTTVAATSANLLAAQCIPPVVLPPPTLVLANGQPVLLAPSGSPADPRPLFVAAPPPQPPPPPIRRPPPPPAAVADAPPAAISVDEIRGLRRAFGLTPINAPFPTSPRFVAQVKQFQHCRHLPETGALTEAQKTAALSGKDACVPPAPETAPVIPSPP